MIYFDNAATSKYKPTIAINTLTSTMLNSCNAGRGSHRESIELASKILDTRDTIKKIFNAKPSYQVIFTKNTTEALNIAILGYISNFKRKIHVITTMFEHNSVLRPLKHLALQGIIDVTILPIINDNIDIQNLKDNIRDNTRLIIINNMSNVTGTVIDVDSVSKIANAYDIPLLVDTAQSLGHIRLDLAKSPIPMLCCAGHKGLHGPQGTGFLIFDSEKITLNPIMYGGTGTNSNLLDMPLDYPECLEVGTINAPCIIALNEAIKWTYSNFENINDCISKYSKLIYSYLASKPNICLYSSDTSKVISFNIKGYSSQEIGDYLSENDIAVRTGLHCAPLLHTHYGTLNIGMVRISPGYNNKISDIDMLISTINKIPVLKS